MPITKSKVKKKEETVYTVELDGHKETAYSKEHAESLLIELQKRKKSRLKDFLIAEKLFDYAWISPYGHNYLVPKDFRGFVYVTDEEVGKRYGDTQTSGILWNSMSDEKWRPPEFEKLENFAYLIGALLEKGVKVEFDSMTNGVFCFVHAAKGECIKEEEYWSFAHCARLALKEAAYQYAKTL